MNVNKTIKTIISILLLAAMALSCPACKSAEDKQATATAEPTEAVTEAPTPEPTEAPTPEPTEAPTQEPTEPPFEPHPVEDISIFDEPLDNFCRLALEPNYQNFKSVLPGDFFDGLEKMLEEALAETGMSITDMGYESFDAFMEATLEQAGMFDSLSSDIDFDGVENVTDIEHKVNSAETADPDEVKAMLALSFGDYLDLDKVTEAYKLNADLTVHGDTDRTDNADFYVYVYDGEYFLVMGE